MENTVFETLSDFNLAKQGVTESTLFFRKIVGRAFLHLPMQ